MKEDLLILLFHLAMLLPLAGMTIWGLYKINKSVAKL